MCHIMCMGVKGNSNQPQRTQCMYIIIRRIEEKKMQNFFVINLPTFLRLFLGGIRKQVFFKQRKFEVCSRTSIQWISFTKSKFNHTHIHFSSKKTLFFFFTNYLWFLRNKLDYKRTQMQLFFSRPDSFSLLFWHVTHAQLRFEKVSCLFIFLRK